MRQSKNRNTWREALVYKHTRANRETIRRAYRQWRSQEGLPMRCDNPECKFHKEELTWNGKGLPLILDHENGNNLDNRPENLRYLCPNCDSQLHTRGGGNIGRVRANLENGFLIVEKDGRQSQTHISSGGAVIGGSAEVSFHRAGESKETFKNT